MKKAQQTTRLPILTTFRKAIPSDENISFTVTFISVTHKIRVQIQTCASLDLNPLLMSCILECNCQSQCFLYLAFSFCEC